MGFCSLTTTATMTALVLVCATADEGLAIPASATTAQTATRTASRTMIGFVCIKSGSKLEYQLHVQAVQVGLAFPHRGIQLGLKSDGVVKIVAHAKGRPVTKVNVVQD